MDYSPTQALYAGELRRLREAAGLTQQALGEAISFASSTVAAVEQCRRMPTRDFTSRCEKVLQADGLLERIRQKIAEESWFPWFRDWAMFERDAVRIRNYEISLVPGLLQTEEYMRALFMSSSRLPANKVDAQVAARLERQTVLTREEPPQFVAVFDDHVLRRPVGGTKVMQNQLTHLVEIGELPNVHLHVIPTDVGAREGLNGSFVIGTLPNGDDVAFIDHPLSGHVIQRSDDVLTLRQMWDAVSAEALPHRQTMDVITEAAKSWT